MLIPKNTYPAQTDDTDPTGYPHGKARNANSPNDGNGFPLEIQWVNDLLGFQQAAVEAAGITPSGNPDKADASDLLDAIEGLYGAKIDVVTTSGTWNKPTRARLCRFILVGGGGQGGGEDTTSGLGGGGGEVTDRTFPASLVPSSLTFTRGDGGSTNSGTAGEDGGDSTLAGGNISLVARGGKGGTAAAAGAGGGRGGGTETGTASDPSSGTLAEDGFAGGGGCGGNSGTGSGQSTGGTGGRGYGGPGGSGGSSSGPGAGAPGYGGGGGGNGSQVGGGDNSGGGGGGSFGLGATSGGNGGSASAGGAGAHGVLIAITWGY